jgi:Ca2+-binding EF-hand superfamily protein
MNPLPETTMKKPLILLCTAAMLSTAAMAGDPDASDSKKDAFEQLDADSDGQLSKEEASGSSSLSASFTMIDKNSDGYISKGEFRRNTMPKSNRD